MGQETQVSHQAALILRHMYVSWWYDQLISCLSADNKVDQETKNSD
jgi:hypothetical protein